MVSRRSSGLLRTGSKGGHQEGAHLTQQCRPWSIWPSSSQSTIKWRSGEDHWVQMGHRTQVRSTQREICWERIFSSHWQRVKVCSHPTSHDTQGHTPNELDSSKESLCVRCGFSVSQYAGWWVKRVNSCSGALTDSIPRTNGMETQTSTLWSQRFTEIMADSFESSSQESQSLANEVRSCQSHRRGLCRRLSHSRRRSLSSEVHYRHTRDLQPQACGVPHSRSPSRVLGSDHQGQKVRPNHDGVSSKAQRQFARSFQDHR